jgi:Divergent InlB B-repeat domain/Kelch motif/Galactose oxidase, central domain
LLPSGQVLVAGGYSSTGLLASAELYDSASNTWSTAGSLATARDGHTATLLSSGKVLVAAGQFSGDLASAELYDPASNTWSSAGSLATARYGPTATLLSSGEVLIAGGVNDSGDLASAELYTYDLGIADSRRPVITSTTSPLILGDTVQLTGTGFTGDSEAAGGGTNSNATNSPLVQLRRIDNEQIAWTSPATNSGRSATSYQSTPLSGVPLGVYALTVFVNAIPSVSQVIRVVTAHTVTPSSSGNGSISPNTAQVVRDGTTTVFILSANAHYYPDGATGTCGGILLGYTFTTNPIIGDCTVIANFAINTYTLAYTAGANGAISGTSPQTVNYGTSGTAVTAVPNPGYHFVQWSDNSTTNPRTDTNVTANISVTATFAINTYTLTYTAGSNGTISGTSLQTVDYGASGTTVTAVPDTNYHFVQWSDSSTTNPRTDMNVSANISVTATFAINTYTLTYTAGSNGSISGTPSQTVDYGASGTTVTAVPDTGYQFAQWSDGLLTRSRTDTNVTANISVTATFAINAYTLTYTAGSNGTIIGTSSQTVNYGANGTAVAAAPNTGYHFEQWSDGSTANPRTDSNVSANISVTASFAINTYTLTYTPGAHGSITGTTSQTVNYGASGTTVTAVPDTGYHFEQWSDSSTTNPRTDTNVSANISVTAVFSDLIFYGGFEP